MPATTSFIKITVDKSIPTRIFVNRLKLLENASVISVNEKSIVKLQKINILKLSNNDIRSLITSIREKLIDILINKPIAELIGANVIQNKRIVVNIDEYEWKCYMCVSVDFLVNVRVNTGILTNEDLEHLGKRKTENAGANLLVKKSKFTFSEEKKIASYRIRKSDLIGSFHDCLDLYIYGRPT